MTVRLLTEEQAFQLGGEQYQPDQWFNPVKDANGNYVISEQEATNNTNPKFAWVADLPKIEFHPYIKPLFIEEEDDEKEA